MRYGTVIQYFPAKGYGFIRADQGPDVFFHITALGACMLEPEIKSGQAVKYELEPGTEPKRRRRRKDEEDGPSPPPVTPRARLVELIDRIPGGKLAEEPSKPHPRSRRKKPTWRR